MTQIQIQNHHHDMVHVHQEHFSSAQEEFRKITEELTLHEKERKIEQWKLDNHEQLKELAEYQFSLKKEELDTCLREARNRYALKALTSGIDRELVKEIFLLTNEEFDSL